MRLFVYEHLMAGGFGPQAPASLLVEGRAMLSAIVEDFATAGHQVSTMLHPASRWPSELPASIDLVEDEQTRRAALSRLSRAADWSLVISPEIDGQLIACCQAVRESGGRLLGPSPAALEICCDKHATSAALRAAGVPAPAGIVLNPSDAAPASFPFPAVLKPCDGAGSQDVQLIRSRPSESEWPRRITPQRLERFCPGVAASVALLVGANMIYPLPPCRQHLTDDGHFTYQGGSLPLNSHLAARAAALARRAVAAVPGLFGYVGIDLVMGADHAGRDDVVIEINPRLTTSYLGLRKLANANLAQALLDVAAQLQPELSFATQQVRFNAQGEVFDMA